MGGCCISEGRAELEWKTGLAGCLIPLLTVAMFAFLGWAIDPGAVESEPGHGRGASLLRGLAGMQSGGISWGFLVAAVMIGWIGVQMTWRFVERVAVTALPAGLRMRGMFGRDVPWHEVKAVRCITVSKRRAIEIVFTKPQPGLFMPISMSSHRIFGVDLEDGAGARFVEAVERMRTRV